MPPLPPKGPQIANYVHQDPGIQLVPLDALASCSSMPTIREVQTVPYKSLEARRGKCLVIYVSTRWRELGPSDCDWVLPAVLAAMRGLARSLPKDISCFLWLDCCSIDISTPKAAVDALRDLPAIVERSDALLVPYRGNDAAAGPGAGEGAAAAVAATQDPFAGVWNASWVREYPDIDAWASRPWSLMELLLCGLLPVPSGRFRHTLWASQSSPQRPMLLYGPHQQQSDSPPEVPPALPLIWFQQVRRNPYRAPMLNEAAETPVMRFLLDVLALQQKSQEEAILRSLFQEDLQREVPVDIYEGEEDEQRRPHGFGNMRYANGDYYSGQWANGQRHGDGTFTFAAGERYQGGWQKDQRHGQGTHSGPDGTYEGAWASDARDGFGTLRYVTGDTFAGRWAANKRQEGTQTYKNGDVYIGPFVDGKREGVGQFTYKGGAYDGEWKGDKQHGQGTLRLPGGAQYTGQFQAGMMHGRGRWLYPDGDVYEGDWRKDKRHGNGWLRPAAKKALPVKQTWDNGNLIKEVREKSRTKTAAGCTCAIS